MDNTVLKYSKSLEQLGEEIVERSQETKRPRKATLLKLQWLAERLRRCERIKKEIAAGTYRADSQEVAKALLGMDFERK